MSDLPTDDDGIKETQETRSVEETLNQATKRRIQGFEQETKPTASPIPQLEPNELTSDDPALQADIEQWKRDHDPANWQYRFGSPHADFQAAKDLVKAERQHDIGVQASTADGLGDAIDTTLKVGREANTSEETPMDEYFREKYGTQPYTTDAYPKEDEK